MPLPGNSKQTNLQKQNNKTKESKTNHSNKKIKLLDKIPIEKKEELTVSARFVPNDRDRNKENEINISNKQEEQTKE